MSASILSSFHRHICRNVKKKKRWNVIRGEHLNNTKVCQNWWEFTKFNSCFSTLLSHWRLTLSFKFYFSFVVSRFFFTLAFFDFCDLKIKRGKFSKLFCKWAWARVLYSMWNEKQTKVIFEDWLFCFTRKLCKELNSSKFSALNSFTLDSFKKL